MSFGDGTALFHEEQKFRNPWILLPLGLMACAALGFAIWALVRQLGLGLPAGSKPVDNTTLILITSVQVVVWGSVFALIWFARLITEVHPDGVYLRYRPFHLKPRFIPLGETDRVEVRDYHPVREYGGWGLRRGWKKRAYSVSGRQGLEILRDDGRRIMIGTQRPAEMAAAVARIHQNR
ncbi:MAG TPA: DUF6141 family protein [Spirochaetota bacterium]|nr:DUF6141 family protein [Spirochaetota bacterium]HPH02405.1 DUF6141 family protein [Spirochaetota bacterium]HPN83180.1 DUF6141 family protein [Spirochaetota bacterium]